MGGHADRARQVVREDRPVRTPVHREVEAWGPIVDRLAAVAFAHEFGYITNREFQQLQMFYLWLWQNTPVK